MSKENKPTTQVVKPAAPVTAAADKCKAEDCKKGIQKFGFCLEHYEWYMEGIIRGDGRRPSDFKEKLALWKRKHASKAA